MHRKNTDTAAGDFVGDVKRDTKFPHVREWQAVELYLVHIGACREAIAAGKIVWRSYIQFLGTTNYLPYDKRAMTIDGVPIVKRVD